MNYKNIEKFSFRYAFFKFFIFYSLRIFYKKYKVIGINNIPKNEPVIFAANHQNTLMDALSILCAGKGQPIFLARADIFNSNFIIKILKFLKIMPIFRIRDGYKNLQNNNDIFDKSVDILEQKKVMTLFPEGSHLGKRKLKAFKKGIARIAFKAEETSNFNLNVKGSISNISKKICANLLRRS